MNETTQNTNGTPYPATEAYRQIAQPDQEPNFSRYLGSVPVTFPENEYAQETAQEAPEPEPVKPYTLKRLQSRDIFPMLRILSKIGINEFKECFSSSEITRLIAKANTSGEDLDMSSVGVNVVLDVCGVIVNNIPKCENDIYAFLAQLSGMSTEDIANMDAVVFFEMIVDVIKKPEFKDFIKVVSGLLK